jgi:hypothetical protein
MKLQPFSDNGKDRVKLQLFSNGEKDEVKLLSRYITLVIIRKIKKAEKS